MAISHIGTGVEIANVETERSEEALTCNRYYDVAKEATLSDFNWPFATKSKALNLITTNPTTEWGYSYAYPNDCLRIVRALSGIRNETYSEKIPYAVKKSAAGVEIYSDQDTLSIEYIENIDNTEIFTPSFVMALSYRIAYYIIPRLGKGDPFKMKNELWAYYQREIAMAMANAANDVRRDPKPESELIKSRF